jgi:hypothetical protein
LIGPPALNWCPPEGKVRRGVVDDRVVLPEGVVAVARPLPVLGSAAKAGADGVAIAIAHGAEDVGPVGLQPGRSETLHDNLAASPELPVQPPRKRVVHDPPECGEPFLAQRRGADDVRVRSHDAVGVNEDAVGRLVPGEEGEKLLSRAGVVEEALVIVGLPHAVIDRPGLDEQEARETRHGAPRSKPRASGLRRDR